jgi:lactoylglutathione lyase
LESVRHTLIKEGRVMKLNHVNLTVTDVRAAGAFLEKYFGLRHMGGNAGMAFLSDEDGFVLTLMKAGKAVTVAYPSTFHIGFFIEGEETVDTIHRRLTEDGFDVAAPERHHAYGFYVEAPGGFTVELGA